jgi:DNA-binding transcriptional LysR family regulator
MARHHHQLQEARVLGGLYLLYPASRHPPRKVTAFRDFALEAVRAHGRAG